MKTRKHGSGMSHSDVVRFSNRLARHSSLSSNAVSDFSIGFVLGWKAAAKYFAHELRLKLREVESFEHHVYSSIKS